jgi:hypothetical protein
MLTLRDDEFEVLSYRRSRRDRYSECGEFTTWRYLSLVGPTFVVFDDEPETRTRRGLGALSRRLTHP